MASLHPAVKAEILLLETSFGNYIQSLAVAPRPEIKDSLLEKLSLKGSSTKKEEFTYTVSYYKYATAASVALMLLCGSLALYFWSKWQGAEERLVVLEEQTNRYADQINQTNNTVRQLADNLTILSDTSVVRVSMKGVAAFPGSLAVVFWNKETNEVLIDPGNLPKPPEGMQYQLWALKDGQPVDAGVFETGSKDGLQKLKPVLSAQAYAVTLEKKGGSLQPTLTAMYVFGEV